MKTPDNRCRMLAEKISTFLKREIILSDDAVHYIDSTFSDPSIETLQALISQADSGEIDSLYELVFSPYPYSEINTLNNWSEFRNLRRSHNPMFRI